MSPKDAQNEEKDIVVGWHATRARMDRAELEVEAFFMPRLTQALEARNFDAAYALIRRCPSESVTRVFMMDRLRQAQQQLYASLTPAAANK